MNLGVGAYRTEELKPYVFSSVRKAEKLVLDANYDKEYLPIAGLPEFRALVPKLLFGSESKALSEGRIATCQALSGTGALTLAAHVINRTTTGRNIYCCDPTWENHRHVVAFAGLKPLQFYRYYKPETRSLDFDGFREDLLAMPSESYVILHACAHNPTGVDP